MTTDYLTIDELQTRWRVGRKAALATLTQGGVRFMRLPPNNPRGQLRIDRQSLERFEARATGDVAMRPVIAKYPER